MAQQHADDSSGCRSLSGPSSEDADGGLRSFESVRRLVAYHQAGHAVVGALLGARVLSVELWDGPPPTGRVEVTGLDDQAGLSPDRGLVRLLAYRLAGPISEAIAEAGSLSLQGDPGSRAATTTMRGFRDPASIDAETDQGVAARLLREHFGDGEEQAAAAVEHLTMSVEGWVRDHWHAIALLAASLLRHRRVTTDEVQSLVPAREYKALL